MATTKFELTNAAWTDLGATPCFVQLTAGNMKYVINATAPGSIDADAHIITPALGKEKYLEFTTTKVWARAAGPTATVIVSRS